MSKLTPNQLSQHIEKLNYVGITFDPDLDTRADLVRFHGFTLEKACNISEQEMYNYIDLQNGDIQEQKELDVYEIVICDVCGKQMYIDQCGCEDGISFIDYECECGNGTSREKVLWEE